MDWCVDGDVEGAIDRAEAEVLDHLRRHAEDEELVALARPIVRETLAHGRGMRWISLDWEHPSAHLVRRDLSGADWPAPGPSGEGLVPIGAGVALAHQVVPELAGQPLPEEVRLELGVVRAPEPSIDPEPAAGGPSEVTRETFLGTVATLMSNGAEAGRSQEELAAWAGATLGRVGEDQFRRERGIERPLTPGEVGEAFVELQRRGGGGFFLVSADDRRVVLGNRCCPYGEAVHDAPALCRTTSASIGGMAARNAGSARVTVDERFALGDRQCRVVVDMGPAEIRPTSHDYASPPRGWTTRPADAADGDGESFTPGFRVSLSLRLPRDHLSVPVVRHLTRYALGEVGVLADSTGDIELALTEACANVLTHSGPGDVYEVSLTIGPTHCEIRVIDVGHGFDSRSLSGEMAATDAESGRGVALMHALMDQVRFVSEPERGTVVHLVKELAFDDASPARQLMLRSIREDQEEQGLEAGPPATA